MNRGGRKRCRIKAGGRVAPTCRSHRPAMRGGSSVSGLSEKQNLGGRFAPLGAVIGGLSTEKVRVFPSVPAFCVWSWQVVFGQFGRDRHRGHFSPSGIRSGSVFSLRLWLSQLQLSPSGGIARFGSKAAPLNPALGYTPDSPANAVVPTQILRRNK